MISTCFDEDVWDSPFTQIDTTPCEVGVTIENRDGNTMYISEVIDMSFNTSNPLTIGWAIGLCVTTVVAVALTAGGVYAFLRSDIESVRTEVSSVRDGAGSDTSALRSDMRADFNRTNDKLDKITETLTDIRIQTAK